MKWKFPKIIPVLLAFVVIHSVNVKAIADSDGLSIENYEAIKDEASSSGSGIVRLEFRLNQMELYSWNSIADWRTQSRTVYSNDFKLRIVELASHPDANVAKR